MQLIGRAWEDGLLLGAVARYQAVTDFHKQRAVDSAANAGGQVTDHTVGLAADHTTDQTVKGGAGR
jgi:hypothetical protein